MKKKNSKKSLVGFTSIFIGLFAITALISSIIEPIEETTSYTYDSYIIAYAFVLLILYLGYFTFNLAKRKSAYYYSALITMTLTSLSLIFDIIDIIFFSHELFFIKPIRIIYDLAFFLVIISLFINGYFLLKGTNFGNVQRVRKFSLYSLLVSLLTLIFLALLLVVEVLILPENFIYYKLLESIFGFFGLIGIFVILFALPIGVFGLIYSFVYPIIKKSKRRGK